MKRGKSNQDKRKKEEKKLERMYGSSNNDFSFQSKWFIIFCVVVVFIMFYILTVYITNKNTNKKSDTNTEERTGEILLGTSFSMSDKEYMVLYYDSSDEEVGATCKELFTNYRSQHGDDSIYYVDMNRGFNKSHTTTEASNKNPETVDALSINGPTLIKINQNKVVEYIEGIEAIQTNLQ